MGELDVKSTPSGARIYINDIYQNVNTPCIIDNIPEGDYTVKLELTGYNIEEEQVSVAQEEIVYIDILLTPILEETGSINIVSNPIEADIYLDDVYTEMKTPAILVNIQPGYHLVILKKDGYVDNINNVNVTANEVSYINVELELSYVKSEISYALILASLIGLVLVISKKDDKK